MTFPTIRWSKLLMAVLALAALTAAFWRSPLYGAEFPSPRSDSPITHRER